jgi:hypothetical protein
MVGEGGPSNSWILYRELSSNAVVKSYIHIHPSNSVSGNYVTSVYKGAFDFFLERCWF